MITQNLYVIAAICGNFWRESTINPGIWENLTVDAPGYGLGQWTDVPPNLTRRTQLFDWLQLQGYAQDDGIGQLQYLLAEAYWTPVSAGHTSAYNTLQEFVESTSTNLNDLTLEYMYHWEGINDPQSQIRLDAAARYYNLFVNDPGTRDPWVKGNFYNTQTDADNNALLIMDFFVDGSPIIPVTEDDLAVFSLILKRKQRGGWTIV